jgi:sugar lactone lactonase YvrE
VAVLPNGGFALTNFLRRSLGSWAGEKGAPVRARLAAGEVTGEVWEWNVGNGWSKVPGSEGSGPNGIEASADGKWLYVADWGARKVIKLSRGQARFTRQEITLDFHPDNLRWQRDGSLLAAGQQGTIEAVLSDCLSRNDCSGIATSVAAVDPNTLQATELVHAYPTNAYFAAGTTGLKIGDEIWVGSTFHGTRIARFRGK